MTSSTQESRWRTAVPDDDLVGVDNDNVVDGDNRDAEDCYVVDGIDDNVDSDDAGAVEAGASATEPEKSAKPSRGSTSVCYVCIGSQAEVRVQKRFVTAVEPSEDKRRQITMVTTATNRPSALT